MSQPTRSIWGAVLKNFINSFKPRQIIGTLKGSDHFGNRYYEIAAKPSEGKRRPSRWFVPPTKEQGFDQEMPAEWESWLRGRRSDPPEESEVLTNLAIAQTKKQNAIAIDSKSSAPVQQTKGFETFPKRPDLEIIPGRGK